MIFIDAREGLSGDMLLAAMFGLLDDDERDEMLECVSKAATAAQVELHLNVVKELDEAGLGISYSGKGLEDVSRSYDDAVSLMKSMENSSKSRDTQGIGQKILDTLFRAEAAVHNLPIDQVHLHEVGRASAILNMFGIGLLYSRLIEDGAGEFVCSTVVTGKGVVVIAHGAVRVPPPACRLLLEGFKHEPGPDPGERATPTGLAAVRVIARSQSDDVPIKYRKRSVGFGTRRFGGRLGKTILIWP